MNKFMIWVELGKHKLFLAFDYVQVQDIWEGLQTYRNSLAYVKTKKWLELELYKAITHCVYHHNLTYIEFYITTYKCLLVCWAHFITLQTIQVTISLYDFQDKFLHCGNILRQVFWFVWTNYSCSVKDFFSHRRLKWKGNVKPRFPLIFSCFHR